MCVYVVCVCVYCVMSICERGGGLGSRPTKNVLGEIGGWGRVPFNEPYAPSLSTIYDGAQGSLNFLRMVLDPSPPPLPVHFLWVSTPAPHLSHKSFVSVWLVSRVPQLLCVHACVRMCVYVCESVFVCVCMCVCVCVECARFISRVP